MNLHYQIGDEPVPGFRLERLLGQGGFGTVWQALAPGGAQVALKIIPLDAPQSYKEIRALALVKRVRHPNIMPIVGIWLKDSAGNVLDEVSSALASAPAEDANRGTMLAGAQTTRPQATQLIAAMGLGDKSLHDRLEECQKASQPGIPLAELLRYMEDAARAIDYLNVTQHQTAEGRSAIHHGDIKPKNIMIVGDAAQVGDLGLARVLGDVRSTRLAISAAYAAPESLKGLPPARSTDQYSLAISYVELRTGELPFEHPDHPSSVMAAHLKGQLDLSRLNSAEQLVIRRATSQDPEDRFESAMDMVIALRDAVNLVERLSGTTSVRRSGRSTTTSQIRTPNRFWARVLQTTAAACLIAGMAWVGFALQIRSSSVASASSQPIKLPIDAAPEATVTPRPSASNEFDDPGNPFQEEPADALPVDTGPIETAPSIETKPVVQEAEAVETPKPIDVMPKLNAVITSSINTMREGSLVLGRAAGSAVQLARFMRRETSSAARFHQMFSQYEKAAAGGNFEAAQAALTAAIDQWPGRPWLFVERARLLAKMHRTDDAAGDLKQALEIDPKFSPAFSQRAALFLAANDYRQASTVATQALLRNRRDVEALQTRALAQVNLRNLRTALSDYDAAIVIDDQNGALYRLRAVVELKLGEYEDAAGDLDRAIQLDEQDAVARRLRALVRHAQRDYQRAVEDREQTARQAPALTPALPLRVEDAGGTITVAGQASAVAKGTALMLESVSGDRLIVRLQRGQKKVEGSIAQADVRPFVEF
jgi:serine/threonine protein kinase/tetratricopeptide (TPR) repeat protein